MGQSDTERLVRQLARDGVRHNRPPPSLPLVVTIAAALSLIVAVALCAGVFHDQIDLRHSLASPWFALKAVSMVTLAIGASLMLRDLARPDVRLRATALLPAILLLLIAAVIDPSGLRLAGRAPVSVPTCLGAIVLLSLPGLALILVTLRPLSATTRPRLAGAAAGLLAGALGGLAYALACRNDGGLFVAVWYGTAVTIVAALGALAGPRAFAW